MNCLSGTTFGSSFKAASNEASDFFEILEARALHDGDGHVELGARARLAGRALAGLERVLELLQRVLALAADVVAERLGHGHEPVRVLVAGPRDGAGGEDAEGRERREGAGEDAAQFSGAPHAIQSAILVS
ncbi:MAG: hypothetical protein QM820_48155 [Minicystis sp.]